MNKGIILKVKRNKLIRFMLAPLILARRILARFKNRKIGRYKDLFSNVKEGRLVVVVNEIPGSFEADIRSHILQRILINKNYEPCIAVLLKRIARGDKDAINIGANIGLFTVLLAEIIDPNRKVLAVEPTPLAFEILNENINRNDKKDKVILFNGICVDKPGEYLINTIVGKEEYSSLSESIHLSNIPENIVQFKVRGETLDYLVDIHKLDPGIVLIDVEGAEMRVLSGAIRLLARSKPLIISELNDHLLSKQNSSSKEVIGFLEKMDYEVRTINNHPKIKYPYWGDILALPKE